MKMWNIDPNYTYCQATYSPKAIDTVLTALQERAAKAEEHRDVMHCESEHGEAHINDLARALQANEIKHLTCNWKTTTFPPEVYKYLPPPLSEDVEWNWLPAPESNCATNQIDLRFAGGEYILEAKLSPQQLPHFPMNKARLGVCWDWRRVESFSKEAVVNPRIYSDGNENTFTLWNLLRLRAALEKKVGA